VAPAVVQAIKEILEAVDKLFIGKYSSIPKVSPKTLDWIDWSIFMILNQICPCFFIQFLAQTIGRITKAAYFK